MNEIDLFAGRYRLVETMGAGGMSVVWRGIDETLRRPVAFKVLSADHADDAQSRELIRREARAAAALSHPHVVRVYDYGEHIDSHGRRLPFLVMELVQGPTLAQRVGAGRLPWPEAVRVCTEVAAGLAAIHARGLVHRDVKPANVMLTHSGAKLVDFGIAAAVGQRTDPAPDGTVLGTPAYLAPERLTGDAATAANDVYALGLLLYRTLTGTMPWPADTVPDMIQAHRSAEPAPMPLMDGLPRQVRRLCMRCLSKDPARRPNSTEVVRVLRAATRTRRRPPHTITATSARGHAYSGRTRRGLLAAAAASVFAGILLTASQPSVSGLLGSVPAVAAGPDGYGPTTSGCTVRYRTRSTVADTFTAEMTVTNTGDRAVSDWMLTFHLPSGERIDSVAGQEQSGTVVSIHAAGEDSRLAPNASLTLPVTGNSRGSNPHPSRFALNGLPCTEISDATGTGHPTPSLAATRDTAAEQAPADPPATTALASRTTSPTTSAATRNTTASTDTPSSPNRNGKAKGQHTDRTAGSRRNNTSTADSQPKGRAKAGGHAKTQQKHSDTPSLRHSPAMRR